ncbi:MAG: putative dual-specificity RNA methyltransferase RlmN [Fimbriimonadaceae bacterium]|nr:putative dual-specificity RNA methyltransferase RlmN [Fimbriimonadaceae bacterium]
METALPALVGLTRDELAAIAESLGQDKWRGKQLARWLYQEAASSFDQMSDLPAAFRQQLAEQYRIDLLEQSDHRKSSDGVEKLLLHGGDGEVFECVLLPYKDRVSCCISTQVGCPMGCTFCATGLGGFDRNLDVGEIVGQVLHLQRLTDRRISHVVFMGMGEPLLNLENVIRAIRLLNLEVGIGARHITVSTVGLVPQILRLAEEGLPIHLALSLHSPFDDVRARLMPVNNRYPVADVISAMKTYQRKTGRKVTFEYLLIKGVNDTEDQAVALARLVKGFPCFVNLIPFNWVDTGQGFSRPSRESVNAFRSILERARVNVTERIERGHDIAAACGQLAGQHAGRFARRARPSDLPVFS